jgi:hypothetical protein
MPEVQEVFRMATQKVRPDPGALERQEARQRRRSVGKKVGAFAVAAAIGLAAVMLIWATRPSDETVPADTAPAVNPTDAATDVARGFLDAFGVFDPGQAMTYVADDADITGMTEGTNDVEGLALMMSYLEASGYRHAITSCEATATDPDITVVCAYDFHAIRSDEIGRGPFTGGTFTVVVRDGEIVRAERYWEIAEFSPQMWEPFADWVQSTHPGDFAVMYVDGGTNFRLTEESIRLWEKDSKAYVKAVKAGDAE